MIARYRALNWAVADDHEADAAALWAHTKSHEDPVFSYQATPLFGRQMSR
jgi:hypothetical protein